MRRFRRYFLLAFFVVSNLATAKGQVPTLRGDKMLDCSGLPCVDVTLASGKHLRLLVDTGNVNSVIDTEVAKSLGLAVAPAKGADGKPLSGYGISVLTGVKLGDASLGDVKIVVMDLATDVKADHMPTADGALAYTAFKDRLLELDYVRRTVRFSDPLTAELACPGFCGTMTTPTFGKRGPPIIVSTGFSVNAKPITAQIDTLFSGTMLIYPPSVKKLDLSEEAKTTKKQLFKYTDGGVDMMEAQSKTEAFGTLVLAKNAPLYFATSAVHLPDDLFDATVGHELFEHSVLSLDFHDMKLWMTKEL
ncbi:MAG TPA: retropepsin-like aspartic protease [Candidatus Acidoferrales bacterium]|nr:retropepsin-like aspartic protease [Candidatus Acidoferrales bacterium]